MTRCVVRGIAGARDAERCMRAGFLLKKALCVLCASVFVFLCALALAGAQAGTGGVNTPEQREKPYLILVSLDGFRADYLDRFRLPNLGRVMKRGARAKWMNPVFPSLTFPNHYSLVTGLHPEKHGIVGNSFYDPARRQRYAMHEGAAVTDGTWYRGEPIWVTAETQGMVAACYFWPGSEAAINGVRPTFFMPYDEDTPNDERVKRTLDWLRLPADRRPHVITLYFSELDTASHRNALDSPRIESSGAFARHQHWRAHRWHRRAALRIASQPGHHQRPRNGRYVVEPFHRN